MTAAELADGIIEIDTDRAKVFGFTSDRFYDASYLWKTGKELTISFIASNQRGNFRQLAERILSFGFTVLVPTPIGRMEMIVRRCGYTQEFRYSRDFDGKVEIWRLEPKQ